MKLIDVIKIVMGKTQTKVSYTDVANALGVTRQYAHQIKSKDLTEEQIDKLQKYFNINLTNANMQTPFVNDCVMLERVHINPSCGHGTPVYETADITPVMLGSRLISDILKVAKPENLKIFEASGDSMSPTIENGDVLLVDVGRCDFNNGGIFLLTINNEWFIKRLRLRVSGELEIISENVAKYGEPEVVHPNDDVEIVVKGRVIKNLSRGL